MIGKVDSTTMNLNNSFSSGSWSNNHDFIDIFDGEKMQHSNNIKHENIIQNDRALNGMTSSLHHRGVKFEPSLSGVFNNSTKTLNTTSSLMSNFNENLKKMIEKRSDDQRREMNQQTSPFSSSLVLDLGFTISGKSASINRELSPTTILTTNRRRNSIYSSCSSSEDTASIDSSSPSSSPIPLSSPNSSIHPYGIHESMAAQNHTKPIGSKPHNMTVKGVRATTKIDDLLASSGSPPLSVQGRYKTEMCRAFMEKGVCKYDEKCQFAHGEDELRGVKRHPKYKTNFCRVFHSTGFCPYGARCHFVHNMDEAVVTPSLNKNNFKNSSPSNSTLSSSKRSSNGNLLLPMFESQMTSASIQKPSSLITERMHRLPAFAGLASFN